MNFNILGVSELKGTAMGKFSSEGYDIYHCGQEFLRRNNSVNKRVGKAVL